jgi:hypothetical protein
MNNNYKKNFNLIPKEIYTKREQKRQSKDKTVFYSAIFPFLAIVVWLIFLLLRLDVTKDIRNYKNDTLQVQNEIQKYEVEKLTNAELVLKTKLLKEIVKNDVNPEDFFKIVQDTINESGKSIKVLEYGKNNTGDFSITGNSDTLEDITDIVRIFREHKRLNELKLNSVNYPNENSQNKYEFEVAFKILALQD